MDSHLCLTMTALAIAAVPAHLATPALNENFMASSGAVLQQLPHVPYEDTLLVQFRFSLPQIIRNATPPLPNTAPICPLDAASLCNWEQQLYYATDALRQAIKPQENNLTTPNPIPTSSRPPWPVQHTNFLPFTRVARRKRSVWSIIGTAVPLVAEYFPKLMSLFSPSSKPAPPESRAVVPYDMALSKVSSGLSQKLQNFQDQFLALKAKFTKNNSTQQLDQSEKITALQLALSALFEINSIDQSASICNTNLLPPRLVRMGHLEDALRQATQRLATSNAQLVIPTTNITAYFKLKAATCAFTAGHFIINFRLPVKKTGDQLALFSVYPVPFKYENNYCFLFSEPLIVAMVNDKPHFLPAHFCPDYEFFCQLPRDKNPSDLEPCLASFFKLQAPTVAQCQSTCRRLLAPIVTEARAGVFWVIPREADRLTVDCPAQVEVLPSIRIGSYAVVLPCSCSLMQGADVLVTPHLLCDQHNITEVRLTKYIPIQWTSRAAPSFLDMAGRPPPVAVDEVNTAGADFEFVDYARTLPEWLGDLLAAIGGALSIALLVAARRLLRGPCPPRRERADEMPLASLASLAPPAPSTPPPPQRWPRRQALKLPRASRPAPVVPERGYLHPLAVEHCVRADGMNAPLFARR